MKNANYRSGRSPLGALARGLLSGGVGVAAMDLLWYFRYRRKDGESGPMMIAPVRLSRRATP